MWHSDTYTKQVKTVREIAQLTYPHEEFIQWFEGAFHILNRNWSQIDYHRMNKYMLLVRNLLQAGFEVLEKREYKKKVIFLRISKNY